MGDFRSYLTTDSKSPTDDGETASIEAPGMDETKTGPRKICVGRNFRYVGNLS
jgi:hypothetical protein